MKIYTKKGDDGTTGLFDGSRLSKSSLRVEVYGTVDELNSIIGIITTLDIPKELKKDIEKLNNILFELGADFANPRAKDKSKNSIRIDKDYTVWLENLIDSYTEKLPVLKNFIIPGGTTVSAYLHNARTVCRRAERLAVALSKVEDIGNDGLIFLNRLSDYLFVAARYANYLVGNKDIIWSHKTMG